MRASRGIEEEGGGPSVRTERLAVRGIVAESAADLAFALLQATHYGILMTDPQGRDLVGNRRFGELFGVDVGGVVEMSRPRSAMRCARLRQPDGFFERMDTIYRSLDSDGVGQARPRVSRRLRATGGLCPSRSVSPVGLPLSTLLTLPTQLATLEEGSVLSQGRDLV